LKKFYRLKGYKKDQLIQEFRGKYGTKRSIDELLKRDTGTTWPALLGQPAVSGGKRLLKYFCFFLSLTRKYN